MYQKLFIEFNKENNDALTNEITPAFPDADIKEFKSFGIDTVIQALVTITTAMRHEASSQAFEIEANSKGVFHRERLLCCLLMKLVNKISENWPHHP